MSLYSRKLRNAESNTPARNSTGCKRVRGHPGALSAELLESDKLSEIIWKFPHSEKVV